MTTKIITTQSGGEIKVTFADFFDSQVNVQTEAAGKTAHAAYTTLPALIAVAKDKVPAALRHIDFVRVEGFINLTKPVATDLLSVITEALAEREKLNPLVAIPGIAELKRAKAELENNYDAFERAIERGYAPPASTITDGDVEELEIKYPRAAAYCRMEREHRGYGSTAAARAKSRLLAGDDVASVIADFAFEVSEAVVDAMRRD